MSSQKIPSRLRARTMVAIEQRLSLAFKPTEGIIMFNHQEPQVSSVDRQSYDDEGYLIVRGLISQAEAAAVRNAFTELAKLGPVAGLSDTKMQTAPGDPLGVWPRMMHPHRRPDLEAGKLARDLMLDPRLFGVLRALLSEEPLAAQSMFYFKPPGARGQALHQDNFYLRASPGTCMAAWIAVDESTPENGGLSVVPGTQHLEVQCPEQADLTASFATEHVVPPAGYSPVPAVLAPGDVLFFNGNVLHGSEPNRSDRFRRSLILHYVPWSAREVSAWYHPLLQFGGGVVPRANAEGGGPCGNASVPAVH